MNYTTLLNQIIAYANRGGSIEFAASIPYFIEMGQQKIWKELNTTGFQKAFEQISIFSVNNGIKELDEFHVTEIAIRVKNAILNAQV